MLNTTTNLNEDNDKMICENCELGRKEIVVGNGITEPPYLNLVRCPFNTKYYKYLDDECCYEEQRKETISQNN